jgi:phage-related tail protein
MNKAKLALGVFVALVVALLAGWLWGTSGNRELNRALQASELRNDLLDGRSAVLDARLQIYSVNFGEASRHLEDARTRLRRADERLKNLARQEDGARVESALAQIDEAQRLVGKLDQSANARAAEAAKTIDAVLGAP